MTIIEYSHVDEKVYRTQLSNGLTVIMHQRPDYYKSFAVLATDYGSIDLSFVPPQAKKPVTSPQGVAHFLEHKLFEKEVGDVMDIFAERGAQVNAFTSYTQTAYYFSATSHFYENLILLLDFVQEPYFTEKSVEAEKPIIAQEILMYDDSADWKIQEILLQSLYPHHPIRYDIAGTVNSIQAITAKTLEKCHQTFYHPENMTLIISGNFDREKAKTLILKNQAAKNITKQGSIKRLFSDEDFSHVNHYAEKEMDVDRSQILLGIRGSQHHLKGRAALKCQWTLNLGLELLFGQTSSHYADWYQQGLIDHSFGYAYHFDRSYDYISIGSQTKQPEVLAEKIKQVLFNVDTDENLYVKHLETIQRRMRGQLIHSLNSLEFIALSFLKLNQPNAMIFDQLTIINDITLADIVKLLHDFVQEERLSCAVIKPNY